MTFDYWKDQGQIYLDRIDYTGNASGLGTTNYLKFYYESRGFDSTTSYTTHFAVKTAKRIKAVDVWGGGNHVRAYQLSYLSGNSPSTDRSALTSVQQFDKNSSVDANGNVTGGTALPARTFGWPNNGNGIQEQTWTTSAPSWGGSGYTWRGDFNGDGRLDIATASGGTIWVKRSTGSSFVEEVWTSSAPNWGSDQYTWASDFNGDGKTDIATASGGTIWIKRSTGTSFVEETWTTSAGNWGTANQTWVGDFDGDGDMDIATLNGNTIWVKRSTGSLAAGGFIEESWSTTASSWGPPQFTTVGDFNGDGKTDIYTRGYNNYSLFSRGTHSVYRSTGSSFVYEEWATGHYGGGISLSERAWAGDFNGDGLDDVGFAPESSYYVFAQLSTGSLAAGGFLEWDMYILEDQNIFYSGDPLFTWVGDFNGDGKADFASRGGNTIWVARSIGGSFVGKAWTTTANNWGGSEWTWAGDFSGDGKTDIATASGGTIWVKRSNEFPVDLMTSIDNGLGAQTTLAYTPSTQWGNTQLPFPVQAITSLTTNDGNGINATTTYAYSGGFYHLVDRDFRGFNYAKVTGPLGPNGERTVSETWFHQGNDTDVDVNDPNVAVGYMKGKPYRVKVKDGSGNLYSEVTTTYAWDETAPYFNPPRQVDTSICDGDGCGKQTRVVYAWYDDYGNVTREDQYGDLNDPGDDRTIRWEFALNTDSWIVGLPRYESIFEGIGTTNKVASTDFYYDGVTGCTAASSNQTPTQGHVTRVVRWLNGGTSPETRMAYDAFGNLICTRDANGNTTTIGYDGSSTFPKIVANPLGHTTTTQYYGVDGVSMDNGLYGQVKSSTDSNGNTITTQYDTFGRLTLTTGPPDDTNPTNLYGKTFKCYMDFGNPTQQRTITYPLDQSEGLPACGSLPNQQYPWVEEYFDGLGRTYKTRQLGPDGKVIRQDTSFNARGQVSQTSLPYFDGLETPKYQTFVYDPLGRIKQVDHPDNTHAYTCHNDWVTVTIDANNHRKRETLDAYGRLRSVDEYQGTYPPPCTTDQGTPYATTLYDYDVLGNLRFVTDAKNNVTEMRYDTLGRKVYMQDPDMGTWTYQYDEMGNLIRQTDAKGQVVEMGYDPLNRLTIKITGQASGQSDLTVTGLSGATTAQVGASYSVTETVVNNGASTGEGFVVAYYLSQDSVVDGIDDTWIGYRWVDAMGAGASSTDTTTFTMPDWVPAGTYYLGAFADDGLDVAESDENNNVSVMSQTVQVTIAPDLEVTALSAATTAQVGASYSVTETVVNNGSTPTGSGFVVAYYLSDDSVVDGIDDTWIGYRWVDAMGAGASSTDTTTFTMPGWVSAGTYYLGAFADDGLDIPETDENNNVRVMSQTVTVSGP